MTPLAILLTVIDGDTLRDGDLRLRLFGIDAPELHAPGGEASARALQALIDGQPYAIADIGMRMLTPREQFRAQGFPDSYIIDTGADGRPMTKTEQSRMCGNSVSPVVAAALVHANAGHLAAMQVAA